MLPDFLQFRFVVNELAPYKSWVKSYDIYEEDGTLTKNGLTLNRYNIDKELTDEEYSKHYYPTAKKLHLYGHSLKLKDETLIHFTKCREQIVMELTDLIPDIYSVCKYCEGISTSRIQLLAGYLNRHYSSCKMSIYELIYGTDLLLTGPTGFKLNKVIVDGLFIYISEHSLKLFDNMNSDDSLTDKLKQAVLVYSDMYGLDCTTIHYKDALMILPGKLDEITNLPHGVKYIEVKGFLKNIISVGVK